MHEAFVIMPFSVDFTGIYEKFIKETLIASGYAVSRADDIENSRNILSDIVNALSQADLIVADLTGTNPNVYYELGIAHAFKKPVILLAQEIDEIPFDLRSYKVILYTTNFIKIQEARDQLGSLAREALRGNAEFGNPVSDFLKGPIKQTLKIATVEYGAKRGIVDLNADFDESVEEINECLQAVSEQFSSIGKKTRDVTKASDNKSATEKRALLRSLASELNEFGKEIHRQTRSYQSAVNKFESSLSELIEFPTPSHDANYQVMLQTFIQSLSESKSIGEESLIAVRSFQQAMERMPNLELNFNIANDAASNEMKELVQIVEKHLSVFSRAGILCKNLLESLPENEATEST